MAILGGSSNTFRGGESSSNGLSATEDPNGLELKAGVSDVFDRYSKIPHVSYELKIPIESLKRTDIFGFYAAVYDSDTNTTYSWPISFSQGEDIQIKEPNDWGKLISPDKSIPEFTPGIALLASMILLGIILITRRKTKLWGLTLRNS